MQHQTHSDRDHQSSAPTAAAAAAASVWKDVVAASKESILGLAEECRADPYPHKIDLTIGAYRTDEGMPCVLDVIREAERTLLSDNTLTHEYIPQQGLQQFIICTQTLMFGRGARVLEEKRVLTVQSLSGTGALSVGAQFLRRFYGDYPVYVPETTWPNHQNIVTFANLSRCLKYRYLDSSGLAIDMDGLLSDLSQAEERGIVILHVCAHNPSGIDPSPQQWERILLVCAQRNLMLFFDNAYQGFASGDVEADALPVRMAADMGFEMLVACSFAKNFGLYGERVGALHLVCASEDVIVPVTSQLKNVVRATYSSPPAWGARLVAYVLGSDDTTRRWKEEVQRIVCTMDTKRRALYNALKAEGAPGSWEHLLVQRGMFSFTGLPKSVVLRLKQEYHIYMLENGRISISSLPSASVQRFAQIVAEVLRSQDGLSHL